MNRTVGAGRKGVAVFPRSAGIRRMEVEGDEVGVGGVAGRCTVAVRRHLGAEFELDLRSTPSPSASPSLSLKHHLKHHQRRRRRQRQRRSRRKSRSLERLEASGGAGDMGSQWGRQGSEPLRTPGRGAASGVCSA